MTKATQKKVVDLVERALWTFAQAFVASWAVFGFKFDKVVLTGAVAAGASALKTFVKSTL